MALNHEHILEKNTFWQQTQLKRYELCFYYVLAVDVEHSHNFRSNDGSLLFYLMYLKLLYFAQNNVVSSCVFVLYL